MFRILKNVILLSLIVLLSAWGWTRYHQRESVLQDKADLTDVNKTQTKASVTETAIQEKQPNSQPELNLNIKSSPSGLNDRASEQGPKPESPTLSSPNSSPTSINDLLPEVAVPKKYLKYGYEGKEEEHHNLKLDIQKDDLNVKLGVQTDKDRNTNVNSVDIEVKLPE